MKTWDNFNIVDDLVDELDKMKDVLSNGYQIFSNLSENGYG